MIDGGAEETTLEEGHGGVYVVEQPTPHWYSNYRLTDF